jgi:hypothetical protein
MAIDSGFVENSAQIASKRPFAVPFKLALNRPIAGRSSALMGLSPGEDAVAVDAGGVLIGLYEDMLMALIF